MVEGPDGSDASALPEPTAGEIPAAPSLDEAEIDALMRRFRLPPEAAERIVDRVTLSLLAKRGRIRDPRRWLLRALRRQCVDWWRGRRRLLARVLDHGLLGLLATPDLPREDRRLLHAELERHLAGLRPECRRVLARRYGLEPAAEATDGDAGAGRTAQVDAQVAEQVDSVTERDCIETLARRLREI